MIFANYSHKGIIELAESLNRVTPENLTKFSFVDNGSSSIESALKMAFQYCQQNGKTEKKRFMCFTDAYHGETLGSLSVGALDDYEKAEECFEEYAEECCAMIIEPLVQGSAGMKIYPPLYLKKLRALCDKHDVLLIDDEIAMGYGRTGKFFAVDHAGISPDIMCISKGLTNGYMSMAAVATTEEIYNGFLGDYESHRAFMHSHTYAGNPLAASVANATLRIIERDHVIEKANEMAPWLNQRFHELFDDNPNVGEVRSIGLINAIELVEDKETKKAFDSSLRLGYRIYRKALEKGLMLRPLGDVMYFNPPLVISKEELEEALDICKWAVDEVLDEIN